jgi:ABC-type transport system substrate-binding protein
MLLDGKIDVIDRVAPWELERLQQKPSLTTGRYAAPTLYFLVPNLRKPLSGSRTFRRALLYSLNRERMLAAFTSKGVAATIVSGPFIKGASLGDPLGYAYDTSIAPRPYEPKLAIALALLALGQAKESNQELQGTSKIPEIVLARPAHETAQFACLMIRRQWEAVGVPVREVEYRPDEQIGQSTEIDFWFVERTVKEPLIDAESLFGRTGLLGGGSSYMELALEKLRLAEDWPTAAKRLQEIHRLCFEETTVLPLWQVSEHFAHRTEINGIRSEPPILDLYQNVERWTVSKQAK